MTAKKTSPILATKRPEEQLLEYFYYQGWNKGGDEAMEQVLAANVQFRGSFRRKPLRGVTAFIEYMHQAHNALANNKSQIQDVVLSENGRKAAVRLTNRGVHKGDFFGVKGSGHEVCWSSAAFFTFSEDGSKITDIWVLGDIDGLKNQIGAPPNSSAFAA